MVGMDVAFQGGQLSGWPCQQPVSLPERLGRPVWVPNEWAELREVVVGIVDDMRVPEWHPAMAAVVPAGGRSEVLRRCGSRWPAELQALARREVDGLADFLARQGIEVRRPEPFDHHRPVVTPHFSTGGGFYSTMPRDSLLAINDTIVETPMAWRSRYFETFAFRTILDDYFRRGARWLAAPKPRLADELWETRDSESVGGADRYGLTESEPVFDAADFTRLGDNVLLGQLSTVTNRTGVQWLQHLLGPDYTVLAYDFAQPDAMHIDITIIPAGPGRVLVNRDEVKMLPDVLQDWEVLPLPPPEPDSSRPLYFSGETINYNVLFLDEQHVLIEAGQTCLMAQLRRWGFEPIPLPFKHFQSFGGSFHCATLDIRRG
ncbi:amidinotransferase [Streptomyces sp. NPDC026206]|uniref:amidinotransferase n=1 Tax=Streptomyces sp. NPDC026206 TaxID=3157089 RepID=UPI0034102251